MNHYHRSLCKNSTRTGHTGYNFWFEQNQQIEACIGTGMKEDKDTFYSRLRKKVSVLEYFIAQKL